ncbi:DsrH/TusB family sulfur metabolism protein [Pleionea litopenaei]|uniref:DsrH/TusB family sulfur metabolism protein n=1 Tax=Pleionea litopenaei TaxID=3070815 RepID=A0AA51RV56_9GAMM|nr:DsrH/TusB family sulfur metabolism protein [Pleionea sp. HL-JVS1]WMS88084.1 DsrH/TusB family sulfur metabolism protein [Pleionea sp. HL-JVS1]
MSLLYLVNQRLSSKAKSHLYQILTPSDAVLLYEDGVYTTPPENTAHSWYRFKPDCQLRGLEIPKDDTNLIKSYAEFAEITVKYKQSLYWPKNEL